MEVNVMATSVQNVFNVTVSQSGSGSQGPKGDPGKSAYEIAVDNGFPGSEQEWLESLVGPQGEAGPKGDPGEQGIQGIQGVKGDPGDPGSAGENGISPHIDETTGNWFIDTTDTGVHAQGPQGIQGEEGPQGPKGDQGDPGQDVLKFYGTQAEYDALPADKLTNGVEHFIAADPQP